MAGDLPELAQAALDAQHRAAEEAKYLTERRYAESRAWLKELIHEIVGVEPDADSFEPSPADPTRAACTFGGFRFGLGSGYPVSRLYAAWVCRRCRVARDFERVDNMAKLGLVVRAGLVHEEHCWGRSK